MALNDKYQIIYADPPWSYNDKCNSGNRGVGFKYDEMSNEDIKNLPVAPLADKNAVLAMWVTWPHLASALDVINSWGFEYKSCLFVWLKRNKNYWEHQAKELRKLSRQMLKGDIKPMDITAELTRELFMQKEFMMGMGAAGTRANSEFCLLAKRRSFPRLTGGMSQVFDLSFDESTETWMLPHTGTHSEKPAEFRDRIVELFGDVPRLELFSRHNIEGWDAWGNEEHINYIDLEKSA